MSSGVDEKEFNQELDRMANEIIKLTANYEFDFSKIFPKSFMLNYTNASSIENFLLNSPFAISSQEELTDLSKGALDTYVYENTPFPSWEAMYRRAANNYLTKRLGLA